MKINLTEEQIVLVGKAFFEVYNITFISCFPETIYFKIGEAVLNRLNQALNDDLDRWFEESEETV